MTGRVEVTFETGLLADFLRQAASVAPTSGKDVTMYAGIVITVDPVKSIARIRATDSMTFYNSHIPCSINIVAGEVEEMLWRLPSNAFSSIVGSLPAGSGRTVTFCQEGRQLSMQSGKLRAKFNLISPDGYLNWEPFNDSEVKLTQVPGLRDAMKRLEWCIPKGSDVMAPITGLLVGPELVAATDRIRFATVKIDTSFDRDLSVPLSVPRVVMGGKFEPEVGVSADGRNWLARVDEETQYSTVLYDKPWPNVRRLFSRNIQTHAIEFSKDTFLDMAKRALQMSSAKRTAKLDVFIGNESLAVFCSDNEMGFLGDQIELAGQATHPTVKIRFMPDKLLDMIQSGDDAIVMHYIADHKYVDIDPSVGSTKYMQLSQLKFDLGKNYQAWCMPLTGRAAPK